MECPACGAGLPPAAARERRAPAEPGTLAGPMDGVVSVAPERGVLSVAWPQPGTTIMRAPVSSPRLPARAGVGLPARLWRQPAVRAAVRAGAGAIALSVGLRLARGWLARSLAHAGPRRRAPALPSLMEHPPAMPSPRPVAARGEAIVETWVYIRQVRAGR